MGRKMVVAEMDLLRTALWTGHASNEEGSVTDTLDAHFTIGHIPNDAAEELVNDWDDFLKANLDDVRKYMRITGCDYGQAAHDFHLTRNGHGAGFWDRGAGDVGERLSEAARAYGTAELQVELDDDGNVQGDMYLVN